LERKKKRKDIKSVGVIRKIPEACSGGGLGAGVQHTPRQNNLFGALGPTFVTFCPMKIAKSRDMTI